MMARVSFYKCDDVQKRKRNVSTEMSQVGLGMVLNVKEKSEGGKKRGSEEKEP
jgi:hypothetical protein